MTFTEQQGDLFSVNDNHQPNSYCLAHCISADLAMCGGIAVGFNHHFDMRDKLKERYAYYNLVRDFQRSGAMVLPVDVKEDWLTGQLVNTTVYNLVTKAYVYDKPTYDSITAAIQRLKNCMVRDGKTKLAIPKLGCGIDGLDWERVKTIIQSTFADTHINIVVRVVYMYGKSPVWGT